MYDCLQWDRSPNIKYSTQIFTHIICSYVKRSYWFLYLLINQFYSHAVKVQLGVSNSHLQIHWTWNMFKSKQAALVSKVALLFPIFQEVKFSLLLYNIAYVSNPHNTTSREWTCFEYICFTKNMYLLYIFFSLCFDEH